jgi:peptide/nickel transport system substrate-binding protein
MTKTKTTGFLSGNRWNGMRLAVFAAAVAILPGTFAQPALAGGSLTVAHSQDPTNLDPIDTFLLAWGAIGSNIFDGLLSRNENIELGPGLATNWEFLDNDERIRFTLRQGVEFHNGEPFNAAAVKYTFDRLLGAEGEKGPQRSNYTSIDHVEIVDDFTVDFIMKQPDPVMITKLAGYGAMIVPPKYIEEVGEETFNMHPVGTGPFKVVKYTPSVDLKLERNDKYWNGTAKIDNLTIRFIPEASTRVSELLSGGVDIMMRVQASSIDTINSNDKVELVGVDGPTVVFARFKTKDSITADERVRKAINMAVDRQTIVDALLKGNATTIASLQSSKSFGFDPDLKAYAYDPEGAKALLKEAGVVPGTEVTFDYRSNDDTYREVAQAIAGYLNAVGLKVKLKPHESNVFLSDIVPNGKTGEMYQGGWGGWTFDFDNTAYLLYHSGERWTPYFDSGTEIDALLESQRLTYDNDVRQKTLRAVAALAHDQALDLPLYSTKTLYAVSKRVKGFVAAPDDRMRYFTISLD